MEVSFDNIEASIVQDEDLPSIVVDNQSYGSRYFVPEITENEKVYRTSRRIADAATSRPAVPQAANMAASVERGTTITGSNLRRQSAGIFSGQQQEINASHRASSHQDEPPTSVSGPPTSPPEHTLTTHKQANTTLQVSLATDTSFVPIKLRSCTTISTFFDMVLAACDLEDQEHTIMGAEVRYAWIPNMRMMIKRKIPDSFAEMLEIVDEAPCWKEEGGGRCWVEIRVVLR
ncbi:hypothetical protein MMC17_005551 [Xylographa soralifera]|nr:hypothetical protein [Xylographa soralifera]